MKSKSTVIGYKSVGSEKIEIGKMTACNISIWLAKQV